MIFMFDEIPRLNKLRTSRKQAWLWIALSLVWLVIGVRGASRHDDFGWILIVLYPIILAIWIRRLVISYREDSRGNQLRNGNG